MAARQCPRAGIGCRILHERLAKELVAGKTLLVLTGSQWVSIRATENLLTKRHRVKSLARNDGMAWSRFGRALACAALGSWSSVGLNAQVAGNPDPVGGQGTLAPTPLRTGELRVPDFSNPYPVPGVVPNNDPKGDPAGAFNGLPGQPFRPPASAIGGGGRGTRYAGLQYSMNAAVAIMYTDNALLGTGGNAGDDLTITPSVAAGLSYSLTENSQLDLNFGVSYRYSLNYQSFTQFSIVPNSYLSYRFLVGDVLFSLYNQTTSSGGNRPELAGNGTATAVDFNRVSNSSGLTVSWAPVSDVSFSSGYSYNIDRGLSDSFGILDTSSHQANLGAFARLGPYWNVGLTGTAQFQEFVQRFQNDMTTYSVGPVVAFTPNDFLSFTAGVRYQISQFSTGGQVNDTSDFAGWVWNVGATQRITRNLTHTVSANSAVNSGLGSNFTETVAAAYSLTWRFRPDMALNGSFAYSNSKQSGRSDFLVLVQDPTGTFLVPASVSFNDTADTYDFSLGTGYAFTERLRGSLGYSHQIRDSKFATRSFKSNTVTLSLAYTF
jgi:hypothetical protein